nr:DUF4129 domain-containing protein [Haloarchaeobius litoreus]
MLLTSCSQPTEVPDSVTFIPSKPAPPSTGGNASFGVVQDPGVVITQPPVVLVLLVATVVVGIVGFVVWADSDDEEPEEPPEHEGDAEAGPEARAAAIGTVAGQVADRLERDAGTENEVFRAWVEMTRHLPVDHPRSSTPSEFADAAVDAGVAREDVAELTALFEEVRYGGEPVTADRATRAVDALRHIEDEYGEAS